MRSAEGGKVSRASVTGEQICVEEQSRLQLTWPR